MDLKIGMNKLQKKEACKHCGKEIIVDGSNLQIADVKLDDCFKYHIIYFICPDCGYATIVQVDNAESNKMFEKIKKSLVGAFKQLKNNETTSSKEARKRVKEGKKLERMREENKEKFFQNLEKYTLFYSCGKKFEFPIDK